MSEGLELLVQVRDCARWQPTDVLPLSSICAHHSTSYRALKLPLGWQHLLRVVLQGNETQDGKQWVCALSLPWLGLAQKKTVLELVCQQILISQRLRDVLVQILEESITFAKWRHHNEL